MEQKSLWERLGPINSMLAIVISILTVALVFNTLFSRTPLFGKIKYLEEERKQLEEHLNDIALSAKQIDLINEQIKDRQAYIEKIKTDLLGQVAVSDTILKELEHLEEKIRNREKEIGEVEQLKN